MNQTTSKVGADDEQMKIDWLYSKYNRPQHNPRRSILIY